LIPIVESNLAHPPWFVNYVNAKLFRVKAFLYLAPGETGGLNIGPLLFRGVQSFFKGQLEMPQETPDGGPPDFDLERSSVIVSSGCAATNARTLIFMRNQRVPLMAAKLSRQTTAGYLKLLHELDHAARTDIKAARRLAPGLAVQPAPGGHVNPANRVLPTMPASFPANMVNHDSADSGIPLPILSIRNALISEPSLIAAADPA
jgi:hypothetical protein